MISPDNSPSREEIDEFADALRGRRGDHALDAALDLAAA